MAKPIKLELSEEDRQYFESLLRSRTSQAQLVQRARILLLKSEGNPIDVIADKVGVSRNSVLLCLEKCRNGGAENALSDAPGRGRNAEITDEEKAWVLSVACQLPY